MYADKATEQKLVTAIKEAAKRIDYSSTEDPEAILAECLMKQDLSDGFAKTAATALNKSYAVYYMSTHDDDSRGNDHRLLDGDKVKVYMCKESTPVCPHTGEQTEDTPVVTVKRINTVQKAASLRRSDPDSARQFKSYSDYIDWLQSGLDKVAREQDAEAASITVSLERLYSLHKEASNRDWDDYTVQCMYRQGNVDINNMLDAIGCSFKDERPMFGTSKQASATPIVPHNDTSVTLYGLADIACGLYKRINKVAGVYYDHLEMDRMVKDMRKTYDKACLMGKVAVDNRTSTGSALVDGVGAIPAFYTGTFGGAVGGMRNIVENSLAMKELNRKSYDDNEVIDPQLMTESRRLRILEAMSDVMADPDLARYPITDLFRASNKLIKANPEFERPDNYQRLIDSVNQVMSQGGRVGVALDSAIAKTLSDISKGRSNITGNVIADIRSGITGTRAAKDSAGFSAIFSDTLQNAAESAKSGVKGIADAAGNLANAGLEYVKDWNKRKLERIKRTVDLEKTKKELEKLKAGKTEEELHKEHMEAVKRMKERVDAELMENAITRGEYREALEMKDQIESTDLQKKLTDSKLLANSIGNGTYLSDLITKDEIERENRDRKREQDTYKYDRELSQRADREAIEDKKLQLEALTQQIRQYEAAVKLNGIKADHNNGVNATNNTNRVLQAQLTKLKLQRALVDAQIAAMGNKPQIPVAKRRRIHSI